MNNSGILLVDDREENLFSLENMLSSDERNFFKATSGNEALKIAAKENISLILLDVQMPGMDGFETAEYLKQNIKTKKIPIIFVTAINKDIKYVLKGLTDGGAVDYLFKPLDVAITRAKVDTLLKLYSQQLELERVNAELIKLNEKKNYFLGMAAHDLRNPLGNINLFSTFLLEETADKLTEGQVEYLHNIIYSSDYMLNLVNNLLDVSKIEAGKLVLKLSSFNIIEFIRKNIYLNKFIAGKKHIKIFFEPVLESINVLADAHQIEQVLNNLISNAIKFSEKGKDMEVLVTIENNFAKISVKDSGKGIPETEMNKLFNPFSKTSVTVTDGESSTGLGLAIVKKIIEQHKGVISVLSKVNVGSVFSFTLPLDES
jgi:signal transduction histidine kinase